MHTGASAYAFGAYSNTTELFVVRADGNVGIGTNNPGAKLHIEGDGQYATIRGYSQTLDLGNWTNGEIRIESTGAPFHLRAAGNQPLHLETNNVERISILGTGNVGIGDTNPDNKLVVKDGNIKLKSNADGNTGILMLYDAAGAQSGQVYPSAGDLRIWSPNDVLILSSGNVGIGTPSPGARLHVYTTGYPSGKFERYGTSTATRGWTQIGHSALGYSGGTGADSYIISQNGFGFAVNEGTTALTITDGGNVGIGTSSPTAKLHVNYSVNASVANLAEVDNYSAARFGPFRADTDDNLYFMSIGGSKVGIQARDSTANGVTKVLSLNPFGGNVGIGTTGPVTSLSLGASNTGISFTGTNTGFNSGKHAGIRGEETGTGHGNLAFDTFAGGSGGGERMVILASGKVLVGHTSAGVHGNLQVTGGIGLKGNSEIRNYTQSDDGSTLRVLGTQFVASNNNSWGYGYTGGGFIASVTHSGSVTLLDVGGAATAGHRFKVINGSNGIAGSMQYLSGTTSRFHVDSSSGNVGIGTSAPQAPLDITPDGSKKTIRVDNISQRGYQEYVISGTIGANAVTITMQCPSYFQAEVVATFQQSNGGTDMNVYYNGIWSNNHTTHLFKNKTDGGTVPRIGGPLSQNPTYSVGVGDAASNSGKLIFTKAAQASSSGTFCVHVRAYGYNNQGMTYVVS